MKYLIIISSFKMGGGAERSVALRTKELMNDGHDVFLLTFYKEEDEYEYQATDVICLNEKLVDNPISRLLKLFSRARMIKKIIKKLSPDVVVSYMEDSNFPLMLRRKRKDTKYIVNIRCFPSQQYRGFYGFVYKRMIKFLYPRADFVYVNSKMLKKDMVENYKLKEERVVVKYNKIDLLKIYEKSNEEIEALNQEMFEKNKIIINVGRFTQDKGQDYLIKAFEIVQEKIPEAKLIFLGEGEYKKHIDTLLTFGISCFGNVKNPFKYMKQSKLFVFTSLTEGFPNVILESLACGLPVISTDCYSGPREILAPDTDFSLKTHKAEYGKYGVLVPTFERNEDKGIEQRKIMLLADVIIDMLENEEKRQEYSRKSIERAGDFR